jgi:hypothetical protein
MTKGCHNCEYAGKHYEDYYKSPCAKCRAKNPPPPIGISLEKFYCVEELSEQHPAYEVEREERDRMLEALADCVFELVDLKEKHPETYKFALAKLKDPAASYSDIAKRQKCRKQNVQYHLKKAVKKCSGLRNALLVDRRFNKTRVF